MCGIVGAVAGRDIVPVLIEGLKRLEYRGYDSAGVAVLNGDRKINRVRTVGKVKALEAALAESPTSGQLLMASGGRGTLNVAGSSCPARVPRLSTRPSASHDKPYPQTSPTEIAPDGMGRSLRLRRSNSTSKASFKYMPPM